MKKIDLAPQLHTVVSGLQRQALQGVARPLPELAVQMPHTPPEGESEIPVLKIPETIASIQAQVEAAADDLESTTAEFIIKMNEYGQAIAAAEVALEPETLAGTVGVFIDTMMKNLTVTGVANITQVTTNELWTKLAVVDRLKVLTSIITKDMIATGAVTSDKIAANAISAAMVDVGQNARWTSQGLIFYAPVVGDQSPTDWANRTPIIALTPNGDVSFSVAKNGNVTAGMTPDGRVFGNAAQFNSLAVGGVDVNTLIQQMPRGVLSVTKSGRKFAINTSKSLGLQLTAPTPTNRQYRLGLRLQGGGSSNANVILKTEIRAAPQGTAPSVDGGTIIADAWQTIEQAAGEFTSSLDALFNSGSFGTNGVVVWTTFQTSAGSFVITNSSSQVGGVNSASGPMMFLEDIGVPVNVVTQAVGDNVPAQSYYTSQFPYNSGWGWQGIARDGHTNGVDSRMTVGGSIYGSDMAEYVAIGFGDPRGALSNSSVTKATVRIHAADVQQNSKGVAWSVGLCANAAPPNGMPAVTWFSNVSLGQGGYATIEIPGAYIDNFRTGAYRSVVVGPSSQGSNASYGYIDVSATIVEITYRK